MKYTKADHYYFADMEQCTPTISVFLIYCITSTKQQLTLLCFTDLVSLITDSNVKFVRIKAQPEFDVTLTFSYNHTKIPNSYYYAGTCC